MSNGLISGYEISFETNVFTKSNTNVYTIWAGNTFGADFYQFKIIEIGKTVLLLTRDVKSVKTN